MNSLSELKEHLLSLGIEIKSFNGWALKVGEDTWLMDHGVFYKNGMPQSLKDKNLFDNYKRKDHGTESIKTSKWRGISCRRVRGDGDSPPIQKSRRRRSS
jgi:hypothetical protein